MTYKLKDEELQKKLDELTDRDLSRSLKANRINIDSIRGLASINLHVKKDVDLELILKREALEWLDISSPNKSGEFDPDMWNWWPNVQPPNNVPMRVVVFDNDVEDTIWCGYGVFKNGKWEMDHELGPDSEVKYRVWVERWETV